MLLNHTSPGAHLLVGRQTTGDKRIACCICSLPHLTEIKLAPIHYLQLLDTLDMYHVLGCQSNGFVICASLSDAISKPSVCPITLPLALTSHSDVNTHRLQHRSEQIQSPVTSHDDLHSKSPDRGIDLP